MHFLITNLGHLEEVQPYLDPGSGSILIQPILLQSTVVLMDKFEVESAFKLIEKEKITLQLGAPPHYILELNHEQRLNYDLSSLRAGLIAGMIAPEGLITQVEKEMGVVSPHGIVGIVKNVSKNYCSVISILNSSLKISAKIKKNQYFGSLSWSGIHYNQAILSEIPSHVKLDIGDTIITSGYSTIFPEGEIIGVITEFEQKKGGDFYEITVQLSTNFKNLSYVHIIGNLLKEEQLQLEKQTIDD